MTAEGTQPISSAQRVRTRSQRPTVSRPYAAIALLYASGLVVASVVYMADGHVAFAHAHGLFLASLVLLLVLDKGVREGLWRPLLNDWGARSLAGFIGYYGLMIALYPIEEVAAYHARSLTVRVGVAFLIGYVAYAALRTPARNGVTPTGNGSPGWYIQLNTLAVVFYLFSIGFGFWKLVPLLRRDLFLIQIPSERVMYQLFGDYMVLGFICFLLLLWPSIVTWKERSAVTGAAWMAIISAISIATLVLLQMVGSNMGSAVTAGVAGFTGIYLFWVALRKAAYARALAVAAVALVVLGALATLIIASPPLRVFGFQPVVNVQEAVVPAELGPRESDVDAWSLMGISLPSIASSSVRSRLAILEEVGGQQLMHSPLTGDLGVELEYAEQGGYIHSLISVQSHLGLIGSVLLVFYLVSRLFVTYRNKRHTFLKIMSPVIIVAAFLGTFFTWMPFWFLVGAHYAATPRIVPESEP